MDDRIHTRPGPQLVLDLVGATATFVGGRDGFERAILVGREAGTAAKLSRWTGPTGGSLIVTPGRREVFYRLTPSGAELAPAIKALTGWGLRHASRPPQPGEPIHPEHVLGAITQFIDRSADSDAPARWHFRFHGDGEYLIESDGEGWSLASSAPCDEPDVTVTTDRYAWVRFVLDPALNRAPALGVHITGDPQAIIRFERLLQSFSSSATAPSLHRLREKLSL